MALDRVKGEGFDYQRYSDTMDLFERVFCDIANAFEKDVYADVWVTTPEYIWHITDIEQNGELFNIAVYGNEVPKFYLYTCDKTVEDVIRFVLVTEHKDLANNVFLTCRKLFGNRSYTTTKPKRESEITREEAGETWGLENLF